MFPTLHITLLGDFRLVYGDAPVTTIYTARAHSLLAYLMLHREAPQPRQHLAFRLWPDSTEAQARTNLRRELHHIRHDLPDAGRFLRVDAKSLQWRPDGPWTLDVADFEAACAAADYAEQSGDETELRTALEAAAACYQGELLPSCYDEWIVSERDRLRQTYITTLERLVERLEQQREYRAAIMYAQRLLRHDPLHEAAYRQLMRLHALNNDRARALRVYHNCVTVFQHELGIEPGPATQEAYERLLIVDAPPPSQAAAQRRVGAATSPLVGRQQEWRQLLTAWHQASRGQIHFALVSGEAGIGKTRLAEELCAWAGQQAIVTARTRSYAAEGQLAYAPVTDWLRTETLQTALLALDAVWRTEVARLLPELLVEQPDLASPEPLTESWQRQRLFEALARAVLASNRPLLLVIDDLQWCDRETLEWLHYLLLRFRHHAHVLIVGTVRTEEVAAQHALLPLLHDLRSTAQLIEIELGPLNASETSLLAAQIAAQELDADLAARLYQETEGNPLFVVESMWARLETEEQQSGTGDARAARASHAPAAQLQPLTPKVQAVIEARIAQLSPSARELVGLAATIGRAFAFDVLAQASDNDEASLVQGLDELCQRRIVREQKLAVYDFSHDKIREVAYALVSTARRRLLHRRVARALEAVYASDADAISGQVATHYEQAGWPEQAIPHYQRAAEVAQRVYANEEAINFLTRALTLLQTLPESTERDKRELALQTALGVPFVALKGYQAAEVKAAYNRALLLCQRLGQSPHPPILRGLALTSVVRSELQQAHELGMQLLSLAQRDQDPALQVEAHYVLGVTLFWLGEFVSAQQHLEQALAHYAPQQQRDHIALYAQDPRVICLVRLAYTLWYLGFPDQAVQRCQAGLALAQEVGHPFSLAYARNFATWLYNDYRDVQTARELIEATIILSDEQGFALWSLMGPILRHWLLVEPGQVAERITQMRQSMAQYYEAEAALGKPYHLALLSQAYWQTGAIEAGLNALDEAFAAAETSSEHWYDADLHRLRGELLLAQGARADEAEACFHQALEVARRQHTKALELRAAVSLSRLWQQQGRSAEAYTRLAAVYTWFTEGFDTPDLRAARALLEALSG